MVVSLFSCFHATPVSIVANNDDAPLPPASHVVSLPKSKSMPVFQLADRDVPTLPKSKSTPAFQLTDDDAMVQRRMDRRSLYNAAPRDDLEALTRIIQICTNGKPLNVAMAEHRLRRGGPSFRPINISDGGFRRP
jgi:hypothetical protein